MRVSQLREVLEKYGRAQLRQGATEAASLTLNLADILKAADTMTVAALARKVKERRIAMKKARS